MKNHCFYTKLYGGAEIGPAIVMLECNALKNYISHTTSLKQQVRSWANAIMAFAFRRTLVFLQSEIVTFGQTAHGPSM